LPPHPTPIKKRVEALRTFREAGAPVQAAVSPLLPLADTESFAETLVAVSDRVIIDHYLIGEARRTASERRRRSYPNG